MVGKYSIESLTHFGEVKVQKKVGCADTNKPLELNVGEKIEI